MLRPLLKMPVVTTFNKKEVIVAAETGTAISHSVNFPKSSYQSAHASSLSSQVSVLVLTTDIHRRHLLFSKVFWPQSPTPNTHKSANPTAAHVRKRLMPHITMRQRTEPSLFKVPSQSSRPWERSKLDKPEKTAREDQRRPQSAKLTTTMVVLVPARNALLLQYAHHPSSPTVETRVLVPQDEQTDTNDQQCRL